MHKSNIAHIITSLDVGGAERLVCDIVEATRKDIFNTMVFCLDNVGILGKHLALKGIKIICLRRKPGLDWRLVFRLQGLLTDNKIDIIHAHQYTSFFYAALAKNIKIKPGIIFTEHGRFYPERRNLKRVAVDPLLSKCALEIIAISEATKNAMVKYDNFPEDRIKVIYNGAKFRSCNIDGNQKRRELNIPSGAIVLVTASRLDPIKNISMLIRAMRKVKTVLSDCRLMILGYGIEYNRLSDDIKKYDLSDCVYLMGHRDDVQAIFQSADIFLLGSFSEGTSVTLLEAMNAGLPSIVTNVGGNPEIVQDKRTGFIVESDDDHAMSELIIKLRRNENLRKQLGEAGKERAKTLFSFENMMRQYEELYIKCAG